MSGGSMNYLSFQMYEFVDMLEDREVIDLAKDMAQLYHDAEWYHSGDISKGAYRESVAAFKKKWMESNRNEHITEYIDKEIEALRSKMVALIDPHYCGECKMWKPDKPGSIYGSCPQHTTCLVHRGEEPCDMFLKKSLSEKVLRGN